MIWPIFEGAVNLYQGFLMINFMRKRCGQKYKHWWIDALFILLIGAFFSILELTHLGISDTWVFVIPLAYSLIASDEKWYVRILWTGALAVLFLVTVVLLGDLLIQVTNTSWEYLLQNNALRIIYVIGSNTALTFVLSLAGSVGNHSYYTSGRATTCFFSLIAVEYLVIELLYLLQLRLGESESFCTYASLGMAVVVVMTVVLFEMMNMIAYNKAQAELALQTTQMVQTHQAELRSIYSNMLATQHDLRHRINAAEKLLSTQQEGINQEALDLLKDSAVLNEFITGNVAMDAILTAKAAAMKDAGITFEYVPYPLQELPIAEQNFCVLISNILDNAVEAVMRLPMDAPSRSVTLKLAKTWDMFSVSCANDFDPHTVRKVGERFVSSKANAEVHGFGTQSIKKIVNDAGGWLDFSVKKGQFHVELMLPQQNETAE